MQNILKACNRRMKLTLLQWRIQRLTQQLIKHSRQSTDALPIKHLRELERIRIDLICQRNAMRTADEIRRIERERGLV